MDCNISIDRHYCYFSGENQGSIKQCPEEDSRATWTVNCR